MIKRITEKSSKERVLQAFKEGYFNNKSDYELNKINPNLLNDKSIALELVKYNGIIYNNLNNDLQNDKDIIITAIKTNCSVYKDIPDIFKNDKEIIIAFVSSKSLHNLETVSYDVDKLKDKDKWLDDKDVILAGCQNTSAFLKCASTRLKDDEDVALTAIKKNPFAILNMSYRLQSDEDFTIKAMKANEDVIKYVKPEIKHKCFDEKLQAASEKVDRNIKKNNTKDFER